MAIKKAQIAAGLRAYFAGYVITRYLVTGTSAYGYPKNCN
jgi:hypothetical protein